jgi:uncharacterized protein
MEYSLPRPPAQRNPYRQLEGIFHGRPPRNFDYYWYTQYMKIYTLRLKPDDDLRKALLAFAAENDIRAGSIVTCVGGLDRVTLRMAGATPEEQDIRSYLGKFEIVSLVGTLSADDCHLHMSASNYDGEVLGGHLKEGNIVSPTAEIVILEDESVEYTREPDAETGFEELAVRPRS